MEEERIKFESWIKGPPLEHDCKKFKDNSSWPGQYINYNTEIAWEAWKQRSTIGERHGLS